VDKAGRQKTAASMAHGTNTFAEERSVAIIHAMRQQACDREKPLYLYFMKRTAMATSFFL
jgi:hypothetical protein